MPSAARLPYARPTVKSTTVLVSLFQAVSCFDKTDPECMFGANFGRFRGPRR